MLDRRNFLRTCSLLAGAACVPRLRARQPEPAAAAFTPREIGDLLAPLVARHSLPGMAAALIERGTITHIGASGVRRLGTDPADPSNQFTSNNLIHIGSCGKAMTASLCAVLIEKGVIPAGAAGDGWGLTLAEALPELKDVMHEAYRAVTLRQLLTHTGGVPNDMLQTGMQQRMYAYAGSNMEARRELAAHTLGRAPAVMPGRMNMYSNIGYCIAGHIAETFAKEAYEDIIREHVFVPCGMSSPGFGAPGAASDGVLDQPRGHSAMNRPVEPGPRGRGDNPLACAPAGCMHMTISDWARFMSQHTRLRDDAAQMDPGVPADRDRAARLLPHAQIDALHQPEPRIQPAYACGWLVTQRPWAKGCGRRWCGRHPRSTLR
jgi:CubicO group peptidase (beta-lactamase class C family)